MSSKKAAYIDITKEWTKGKKNRKIKQYQVGKRFIYRGNKYMIDNHLIVYQFDENEYNFALWLTKRIDKQITLIPKINFPKGIKTPDYRIGNTYFDLKTIHGSSKQIIYHKIYNNQRQAESFILNVTLDCKLSLKQIIKQINDIFSSNKDDQNWVKIIAIKYKGKFLILKKKR